MRFILWLIKHGQIVFPSKAKLVFVLWISYLLSMNIKYITYNIYNILLFHIKNTKLRITNIFTRVILNWSFFKTFLWHPWYLFNFLNNFEQIILNTHIKKAYEFAITTFKLQVNILFITSHISFHILFEQMFRSYRIIIIIKLHLSHLYI